MDNQENINVETKLNGEKKAPKEKKLRNQFMLKKGSYSIVIIAFVLAALILFNWLLSVLGERFHLEIDMTPEKVNSMNKENIEFIKNVEDEISIIVCADESNYVDYMSNAQINNYVFDKVHSDYYQQTLDFIRKYASYNKNISVKFADPQTPDFLSVAQKYSGYTGGDIIVSCEKYDNRYKVIGFTDIYSIELNGDGSSYTIVNNNIETALTSAIAYCVSSNTAKIAFYTGHSSESLSQYYESFADYLRLYNFDVTVLGDKNITSISEDYDAIVIIAPERDFINSEIDAINTFLDNGGKLQKSMFYFGSAALPRLENFESLLAQWGISVGDGVLFETDAENDLGNHIAISATSVTKAGVETDEDFDTAIVDGIGDLMTSINVPLSKGKAADASVKVNPVAVTGDSVVIAPLEDFDENWNGYTKADMKQYASVIEAKKLDYNSENEKISSRIYAFGSMDYLQSYRQYGFSNLELTLSCIEHSVDVEDLGISFIPKTISTESFVTTGSAQKRVNFIFVKMLPLLILAIGVFVYIRRRNA
jgi:hypothetical protein